MIICIFGPSLSGKTTIAAQISRAAGLPVRHCGEAVRGYAHGCGISVDKLSAIDHKAIDEETLAWARKHETCIVEGRFLDHVFAGVDANVFLVRLMATVEERARRLGGAGSCEAALNDVETRDRADQAHRSEQFATRQALAARLQLDTSVATVDECVREIVSKSNPLG